MLLECLAGLGKLIHTFELFRLAGAVVGPGYAGTSVRCDVVVWLCGPDPVINAKVQLIQQYWALLSQTGIQKRH